MPYTVEIRLDGGNLAARMSEMRVWRDPHQPEPGVFQYRMDVEEALLRVDFKISSEAEAFALDLACLARLEADKQPPRDRPAVDLRLRDLDAHQPISYRPIVLPAAPTHRIT